jgi:hypothetical protein
MQTLGLNRKSMRKHCLVRKTEFGRMTAITCNVMYYGKVDGCRTLSGRQGLDVKVYLF